MHKGIYIALSGAILKQDQLDVLTHNIANSTTTGFKKSRITFRDCLLSRLSGDPASDEGRSMSEQGGARIDLSAGNAVHTGNPLDVALDGRGFIALEGNLYTRRGDLRIGREGFLETRAGDRVLGEDGPIRLPEGKAEITPWGEVRVDGVAAGTIRVVDFADPSSLRELDRGRFASDGKPVDAQARFVQGHLEAANVDVVREMVVLIATMREFETYQKAVHAFDEAAAKVNNELARL